jgi:hypothetical protein
MNKISIKNRLYLTLIGANLNFLALFFFIIGLLKLYGESPDSLIAEIFTILIGSLMIFVGLKGFNRNNPKKTVR